MYFFNKSIAVLLTVIPMLAYANTPESFITYCSSPGLSEDELTSLKSIAKSFKDKIKIKNGAVTKKSCSKLAENVLNIEEFLDIADLSLPSLIPVGKLPIKVGKISLINNSITSLEGIEQLADKPLTFLSLANNDISDISLLGKMVNVDKIVLSGNKNLSELAPLATLVNLTDLNIRGTKVTDISPLANLPKLKALWVDANTVSKEERTCPTHNNAFPALKPKFKQNLCIDSGELLKSFMSSSNKPIDPHTFEQVTHSLLNLQFFKASIEKTKASIIPVEYDIPELSGEFNFSVQGKTITFEKGPFVFEGPMRSLHFSYEWRGDYIVVIAKLSPYMIQTYYFVKSKDGWNLKHQQPVPGNYDANKVSKQGILNLLSILNLKR